MKMKKPITQEMFNALMFCMAQRAVQENKIYDYLNIVKSIQNQSKEGNSNAGRI